LRGRRRQRAGAVGDPHRDAARPREDPEVGVGEVGEGEDEAVPGEAGERGAEPDARGGPRPGPAPPRGPPPPPPAPAPPPPPRPRREAPASARGETRGAPAGTGASTKPPARPARRKIRRSSNARSRRAPRAFSSVARGLKTDGRGSGSNPARRGRT